MGKMGRHEAVLYVPEMYILASKNNKNIEKIHEITK